MNNTTSNQLIKLAYDRPELRDAIMPRILLAKGLAKTPEAAKNMWEKYKEKNPGTRKQPADFYEKPEEGEARKEKSDKEKSKADKGKEKNESRQKDQKKKVLKKIYEKDRKRINEEIKNMDSEELQSAIKQLISDQRSHGFGPAKSKHPEDSPEYALEKVKASPYSGEEYKYYAQALVSKNKKETSKKQTERNEAAKDQKKTNRTKKVNDLASKHGISPEGLKKLKSFTKKRNNKLRKDKAEADKDEYKDEIRRTQKSKSPAELKREFMNNTDPETRKRILKMSPAEFEAMMAAIMEEEDGKQASLRTKLIRLAHAKPELREKILPLLNQKTARRLPDLDYMIPVAKQNGAKEENFANGMIRAWRWETEFEENGRTFTKYHLLMGTASKRAKRATVWEYHTNAASRDRKVKEIVASFERRAKEKAQRREEAKNFQHGYQVGDILVSVWGYDQTNVEFYQVTELIGSKSIEIQMVSSKVVKESRGSEMVVPIKDRFIRSEKPLRKKVDTRRAVKLNSYSYARPWSGKPISQTSSYAGH